jgi:chromosome segregation ATPase
VTAGVAAAKSSSRICSWVDGLRRQVAGWESRDAKMDRVRYQISNLDAKIKDSLGPIAEKMQEAEELQARVKTGRTALERQAKELETLTQKAEKHEVAALDRVRLTEAFHSFKRDKHLQEQREKRLKALDETIAKLKVRVERLYTQKVEFERQLAELELREQDLRLAQDGAPAQSNDPLIAEIRETLNSIKRSQSVDQKKLDVDREIRNRLPNPPAPPAVAEPQVSPQEVRRFLDGKAPAMPQVVHGDDE